MVELFFFVLALLAGVALGWYLQQRDRQDEDTSRDAQHAAQLKQLQDEVREADSAHVETKERLIALQQEHQALQEELARLKRGNGAAAELAAAPSGPDDLTRIKGIGKVMEKKLQDLGITSFRQLAELSPAEIQRINQAIEFPGRVERERWVEQARSLMSG